VTLDEYVDQRRAEVEAALDRYLPDGRCPGVIAAPMQYSLKGGGKRVRPILVLAANDSLGGDRALALPAACAIEMIHTYSLIHDDLPAMDDDELRRGRPTSHVMFGEGLAILAGDGLQAEAFALLAREPLSRDAEVIARKLRVVAAIAEAAGPVGMVGGQAIDLASDPSREPGVGSRESGVGRTPVLDAAGLGDMHGRKTGALIRASVASGAIMAGADETALVALDRYGSEIGLAFQIVDDILDVEVASADLGKTAGKDAAAGKPTYPALFGLERSRQMANDCRARALAALAGARLDGSRLADIASWIVGRKR
jgi:geranylgeranyl diphosphate synthase type II